MVLIYNCIIVGAGPSGAAAAYHLAKRGRSVLLLEKETLPRYKPCGGGVGSVVQEWFDFDFEPGISAKVDRIRYTHNLGDPVEALTEPVWMVRREIFDHLIVQHAQKQGVEVHTDTNVLGITPLSEGWQVQTSEATFTGSYLIGADGAKGPMARWLGLDRKILIGGAIEAEVAAPVPQPTTAHFEFGLIQFGYLWNFPKVDGHSIGAGTFGRQKINLKQPLAQYAQGFGLDLSNTVIHGHPLLLWQGDSPLDTHCALLVGESAGIVDPFTAEGIRPSLHTGILAAQYIDRALAGETGALSTYTQAVHEQWGQDLIWAKRLAEVFYRLPTLGYHLGIKRPGSTARMGELFNGKVRYRTIAQRALNRLRPVF